MMNADNVVSLRSPEAELAEQIRNNLARAKRDSHDMVECSVAVAEAFYKARQLYPRDIEFTNWVKENKLDNLSPNERKALVIFGADPAQARHVFKRSKAENYWLIWGEVKFSWKMPDKKVTKLPLITHKPKNKNKFTLAEAHRRAKLGEYYEKIKDTSLDTTQEKDALIKLIDSQSSFAVTFGGEKPLVPELVQRAAIGELVSAVRILAEKGRAPPPTKESLIKAWSQSRVLAEWLRASKGAREQFVLYLMDNASKEEPHGK
jgi:hypothetical protein